MELGYQIVPPGCLATTVTFLEMTQPSLALAGDGDGAADRTHEHGAAQAGDITYQRLTGAHVSRYRALFAEVGAPWLWFSRLAMPVEELERLLDNTDIMAFAALKDGEWIGLMEVDFRTPAEAELAYFGLVPGAVGSGFGRPLMDAALKLAWSHPIRRLMVHTCTLDHPRALSFYQRAGFRPFKTAIEVMIDPRLNGILPRDCAPHVPMIEP